MRKFSGCTVPQELGKERLWALFPMMLPAPEHTAAAHRARAMLQVRQPVKGL